MLPLEDRILVFEAVRPLERQDLWHGTHCSLALTVAVVALERWVRHVSDATFLRGNRVPEVIFRQDSSWFDVLNWCCVFTAKLVRLGPHDAFIDVLADFIGLRLVDIVAAAVPVKCGPRRKVIAEVDVAHVLSGHDGALGLVSTLWRVLHVADGDYVLDDRLDLSDLHRWAADIQHRCEVTIAAVAEPAALVARASPLIVLLCLRLHAYFLAFCADQLLDKRVDVL